MDVQHRRRIADIPILISFIILMTIYIGVVLFAVQNGHAADGFTYVLYIHKLGIHVDSTPRVAIQILNEINQARFVILAFAFLSVLWSISTIFIVRKATSLVIYTGIICEVISLLAFFILTIFASQSQMYKHSSSRPYLCFLLFIGFGLLKLLALKEVGVQFLSHILKESCRVITSYWFGFLVMLFIHMLSLSTLLFGFYIFCQLLSTSIEKLCNEVQTEDGTTIEFCHLVMVSDPIYIYLFHLINIISIIWLYKILWYFGYVILSESFAVLYQNPEENRNSMRTELDKSRTIVRYHIGTIIYAASPCAFIIQMSAMWKYAINSINEYLQQQPFLGSVSWLLTFYYLPETGMVFCSLHKTAFKESAKLVGKLFIHNPTRLLTIYTVLDWLSLFLNTFVTVATFAVFHIYTKLTNDERWASTALVLILLGAVAMTGTVCHLFRIAVLSIYLSMVQNIQQASHINNMKLVNPAIQRIAVQSHDYI